MSPEVFLFLLSEFAASIIGAVPFGLVNLSVRQTALNKELKATLPISYGASLVEVAYSTLGIFAGSLSYRYIQVNIFLRILSSLVLVLMGILFMVRKSHFTPTKNRAFSGILYGVRLNLLSLQVLAYWIKAISLFPP